MLKITHQGAPLINTHITCMKRYSDVIVLVVDLKSKHCGVMAHSVGDDSCPAIIICANQRSLHLNEEVNSYEPTDIEFPEYKGWDIFLAEITRYTLRICLIKREN